MSLSFDDVRKAIFDAKPVFRDVLTEHGNTTLFDYYASHSVAPCSVSAERKEEFLSVFSAMVERILGSDVARTATADLRATWRVSTAEHHGILTDPYFGSSPLVDALVALQQERTSMISLACAGVSISNPSFPRGFIYHTDTEEIRVPLMPRTHSGEPVYSLAPFTGKEARVLESVRIPVIKNLLSDMVQDVIKKSFSSFSDQSTYLNFLLFKQIPSFKDLNLVQLSQEEIVVDLVLKFHIDTDTWISRLISDVNIQETFDEYFHGVTDTFLFWGIEGKKRVSLSRGDVRISTTEAIKNGLKNKTLLPAMTLIYPVLMFYYGLTCSGGFSQVNYATRMKTAFIAFAQKIGVPEKEIEMAQKVETLIFSGDIQLPVIECAGHSIAATPLDVVLRMSTETMQRLDRCVRTATLKEAVESLYPVLYAVVADASVLKVDEMGYTMPYSYVKNTLPPLRF